MIFRAVKILIFLVHALMRFQCIANIAGR